MEMNHDPRLDIPPALAKRLVDADAVIFVTITEAGQLAISGVPRNPPFQPGLDASHALVQAISDEFPNLVAKVQGNLTDADRYRAQRAFARLAYTHPEQFEAVNVMLAEFEEAKIIPLDAAQRTSADFDKFADFLAHALIETTPGMTAPTTNPEPPALSLV